MNNYLMQYDMGDGIPTYTFIIKTETDDMEQARDIAWRIIEQDYPEHDMRKGNLDSRRVTAETLLDILTLN